jgi:DNA-binding transcriptional LysR family regulator
MAGPHLHTGRLISVLDDYQPAPWDLYVYRPQRGPVPARIRLVYDHIVEALSDPKTLADFKAIGH